MQRTKRGPVFFVFFFCIMTHWEHWIVGQRGGGRGGETAATGAGGDGRTGREPERDHNWVMCGTDDLLMLILQLSFLFFLVGRRGQLGYSYFNPKKRNETFECLTRRFMFSPPREAEPGWDASAVFARRRCRQTGLDTHRGVFTFTGCALRRSCCLYLKVKGGKQRQRCP